MENEKHTPTPWKIAVDRIGNYQIKIGRHYMTCVGDDAHEQLAKLNSPSAPLTTTPP